MKKAACLIIFLTLTGCGDSGTTVSGPGNTAIVNSPPQTPAPTATPGSERSSNIAANNILPDEAVGAESFEGTSGITEKKNPGITGVAIMSAVRTARHGSFDRVVFEFMGPELPGYHIGYIDEPVRSCGAGDVVPFAGDGALEIRFTDAQAHAPEGDATIKDRSRSPNLPAIRDLKITCDFESEVTWVAGVASPNKYRVIELKNPTRLAVDIKH